MNMSNFLCEKIITIFVSLFKKNVKFKFCLNKNLWLLAVKEGGRVKVVEH